MPTSTRGSWTLVNAGEAPFPNEAGLPEALAATVADGRLRAVSDTAAAVAEGPDLVVAVPPLVVDASARPDWGILDAVVADIGRGLKAGTTVSIETTVPVGTTRARVAPGAGGRVRAARGHRLPRGLLAGADLQRARDRRPRQVPQAGRRPQPGRRGARHRVVRVVPGRRGPRARQRRGGRAEQARRDHLPRHQHRLCQRAGALRRHARHRRAVGHRRGQLPALLARPPAGDRGRRPLHPGLPALPAGRRPRRAPAAGGARDQRADARLRRGPARRRGRQARADPRRRLPRRRQGDGVQRRLRAARRAGRPRRRRCVATDPLFNDDELRGHGFTPWDGASEVDAAVVQADHAQYATLTAADLPGVTAIVDGRGILDAANFPGIPVRRIGRPEGSAQDAGSSIAPRS